MASGWVKLCKERAVPVADEFSLEGGGGGVGGEILTDCESCLNRLFKYILPPVQVIRDEKRSYFEVSSSILF